MVGNINVGDVVGGVSEILGYFKKHPALAAEMEDAEKERDFKRDIEQILLNKTEAAQGWFKGGWRPFIGWVCGFAFAYNFVFQPFLIFGFTMAGFGAQVAQLPDLSMFEILSVLGGMLGLSRDRSNDKRAGVHKK